jgi:gliding motility-associated-like protein
MKVSIFVENAACPNDNKGFRVTFNKNPQARPAVTRACEGGSISINNNSCPVSSDISFLWEFSDGRTSTSTYPSISFADPNQTYKVKLTATSKNCGVDSGEIEFKMDKLPVPDFKTTGTTVIGKDTVVCLSGGGAISLDGTVSIDETSYNWQISGGNYVYEGNTNSQSGVLKVKLQEVKEYTITFVARNNCGSKTLVRKIRVVDLPALVLTPQPDVCEEIIYKIPSAVAGAVYTLNGKTIDPAQAFLLAFSDTPYIVFAQLSNACGTQILSDTFTVGAAKAVKILSFPGDTSLCVSTSPIALKANQSGGEWSTAGIETQGGQQVFVPKNVGEYVISYSKGVGKCFTTDLVRVKVEGVQATAQDQSICASTTFVKLQGSPSGGTWASPGCTNCVKGDTLFTANLSGSQIDLSYSVSNATGCKAVAKATITVGRPKAVFSMNAGCFGSIFQPKNTSTGAGTYRWLVNGKEVSVEAIPKLSLLAGRQKITLIAGSGDCSDSMEQEINVVAPPAPIHFTPSETLGCAPLTVSMKVDGASSADVAYIWDLGNGKRYEGFQPPVQQLENQEKENKTFKFIVTAKNSCGQQTDSQDVVVRPKARAEIGVDSTTLRCTPANLLFSNRSSGHDKNQSRWSFGDGTTRVVPGDTVYHSYSAKDNARTFRVKLDIMSACGQDTDSVDIQVYPTTVKALFTMSKSVVCPGEAVRFTDATVPKPDRWIWKFDDGTVSTLANPLHSFARSQHSYKVTLVAFTSCGYDSTQLTVRTTDAVSGMFDEVPLVCEGSQVQFVNKTDTQLGFVWDFGDGSPQDSINYSPSHTYANTGNYVTSLTVYRGTQACKALAKKAVVSVVSGVVAAFGFGGDSVYCAPGPVNLVNESKNADSYKWYFSDGRSADVETPSMPFDPGIYSVKLVASKGGVCMDSVEKALAIMVKHCQIDIPEAFTPNADGVGDRYTLFGSGILKINRLLIRNRWGEIVFEMKDVVPGSQRHNESWDGTFNGKPAPADMYVYEATVLYADQRTSEKLRGNIYLIR